MKVKGSQKIEEVLRFIESRFGIKREQLQPFELVEFKDIWIASRDAARFKTKVIRRRGLRFARVHKKGFKLTTAAMQVFGKHATKNVVILTNKDDVIRYVKGENLSIDRDGQKYPLEDGQVIVKFYDDIIGSGLLKGNTLKNQIPKGRRLNLYID